MLGIFHGNGNHDHTPEKKLANPGHSPPGLDDDLIRLDTEVCHCGAQRAVTQDGQPATEWFQPPPKNTDGD